MFIVYQDLLALQQDRMDEINLFSIWLSHLDSFYGK